LGQVVSGVSFRTPPASPYVTRSSHLCLKVYGKKKKKRKLLTENEIYLNSATGYTVKRNKLEMQKF
jgi:hypothetical protein